MELRRDWQTLQDFVQNPAELQGQDLRRTATRIGSFLCFLPMVVYLGWRVLEGHSALPPLIGLLLAAAAWYVIDTLEVPYDTLRYSYFAALIFGLLVALFVVWQVTVDILNPEPLPSGIIALCIAQICFGTLGLAVARSFHAEALLAPVVFLVTAGASSWTIARAQSEAFVDSEITGEYLGVILAIVFATVITAILVTVLYGASADLSKIIRRRIDGNVPHTKTVVTPAAHPPVSNQTVLTPALYQPQRKIQTVQPAVPVVIVGAALAVLVMVLYFFQREEEA